MKEKRLKFMDLLNLKGYEMSNPQYRAMLDYIEPKCYVEALSTQQYGTVVKVIRNKKNIPVCVKVKYAVTEGVKEKCTDYISVDRINLFEPYRIYTSNENDYSSHTKILEEDGESCGDNII